MDTTKLIKPCPRCGTDIEPDRHATLTDHLIGGITAFTGGAFGFFVAGPVGAAGGAVAGYEIGKHSMMSIEDEHDEEQWFKFKCPNCGCNWKEKIHTNDDPQDNSSLMNMGGYH